MAKAHLIIKGRVQGVGYRYFVQDLAIGLNLKGWVRNLSNGDVEALFEGQKVDIEKAIEQCRQGPPLSRVIDIQVNWSDKEEGFTDFRITR